MAQRKSTFAERLNRGMKEKGIRAVDLSRQSRISESMISCYRSGRYEATQTNLEKLAAALNVSIPWLMGYDVPMGQYEYNESHKKAEIVEKLETLTNEQREVVETLIDAMLRSDNNL